VDDPNEADVVFWDLHTREKSYEAGLVYSIDNGLPVVIFDFWDYFGMSKETWPHLPFASLRALVADINMKNKCVWFVRKMSKEKKYPTNIFPIEHIIEYDFPLVSKNDLFNREFDVCFIGNESPQRRNVVKGLIDAGFKVDIHWTNEKGKLPHDEWIKRHYNAKFFLEADGGGFGSERPFKLMSIAPMLRQANNMLRNSDWVDCNDCCDIGENITDSDIDYLSDTLSDSGHLYELYLSGHERLKTYFSAEYRANYILSILKQNGI